LNKHLATLARISLAILAILSCSQAPNNGAGMDIQNDKELNFSELMSFGKTNRPKAESQVYTTTESYDEFDFHKSIFSKKLSRSGPEIYGTILCKFSYTTRIIKTDIQLLRYSPTFMIPSLLKLIE
jgi:hypothetical protein